MDPVSLAVVTTAASTLGMEAGKAVASQAAKDAWAKVKGWLGWKSTPATPDLAAQLAESLEKDPEAAEKIVRELQAADLGPASQIVAKLAITTNNTTGTIIAGGKVTVVQAKSVHAQGDMNIGGG